MLTVNNGLRELYILDAFQTLQKPYTAVAEEVDFRRNRPPGLTGQTLDDWCWEQTFDFLLPFMCRGFPGYDGMRRLLAHEVSDDVVDYDHLGDLDRAIAVELTNAVVDGDYKLYATANFLDAALFKKRSSVSGRRNKITAIDTLLGSLDAPRSNKHDYRLGDLPPIIAACDTYLADSGRSSSGRRPAVQELRRAAIIELCFSKVSVGDYDELADYIRADPLLKNARSRLGFTLFGYGAYYGATDQIEAMLRDELDHNAVQPWGWTPIDITRCRNTRKAEFVLEGLTNIMSSTGNVDAESTVEALLQATAGYLRHGTRSLRQAFETLYANDLFKPILDLAAADARGFRRQGHWKLRLYFDNFPTTGRCRSGMGGAGAYESRNNSLVFCGKAIGQPLDMVAYLLEEPEEDRVMLQRSMEGTLIHELTHFAANRAFGNTAVPYPDSVPTELTPGVLSSLSEVRNAISYFQAYIDDYKLKRNREVITEMRSATSHTDQCGIRLDDTGRVEELLYLTLFGHVFSYHGKGQITVYVHEDPFWTERRHPPSFSIAIAQEIVSHISQGIQTLGLRAVQRMVPSSLDWYRDVMLPAFRAHTKIHGLGDIMSELASEQGPSQESSEPESTEPRSVRSVLGLKGRRAPPSSTVRPRGFF